MVCAFCIHNSIRYTCKAGILRKYSQRKGKGVGIVYPIECDRFDMEGGAEIGL